MKNLLVLVFFSLIPVGCATTYNINQTCDAYEPGGKIWISPITTLTVLEVRPQQNSIVYHGYLNYLGVSTDEIANFRGPLCR